MAAFWALHLEGVRNIIWVIPQSKWSMTAFADNAWVKMTGDSV